MSAGMAETTFSAAAIIKLIDDGKFCLHHRDHHQLCNTFADFDTKAVIAAIPAGDEQLSLVVRINQTNQIAQHDAMFMSES